MKFRSLTLALCAIRVVAAQTMFTNLIVMDVDQGAGTCLHMPLYATNATAPITDLTSPDMACVALGHLCSVKLSEPHLNATRAIAD